MAWHCETANLKNFAERDKFVQIILKAFHNAQTKGTWIKQTLYATVVVATEMARYFKEVLIIFSSQSFPTMKSLLLLTFALFTCPFNGNLLWAVTMAIASG